MDEDERKAYLAKALGFGLVTPAQWMRMIGVVRDEALAREAQEEQSWAALRERWQDETDR